MDNHGLSSWGGGYIDSYGAGGWKNGGGWALQPAPVQAPGNGGMILRYISFQDWETLPVNPAGNVTGLALQQGATDGQEITVVNQAPFTLTFAEVNASNVADGASDTIAPLRAAKFRWLAGSALWYRVGMN
jgi:hypothetical protein